ncbi:MAG: hypothetical protein Q9222_000075 [Ikaeria aurantiellina]
MDAEEDDDIYASGGLIGSAQATETTGARGGGPHTGIGQKPADLEEGEEEDEDDEEEEESDSDIDIITERKEEPKPEPAAPLSRVNAVKLAPGRTPSISADVGGKTPRSPAVKLEASAKATPIPGKPGSSYPAVRTSTIDADHVHDADFSEDEKPWRRPGTDMTDFFNYGFDEFTWASYCLKQDTLRKEVTETKKQMEDMQNFMNMPGGMPAMPGMPAPAGGQGAMPSVPGMEDIPQELQQMMQEMIAQGMDPTQVSPEMLMQMMGGQGGGNTGQGQNYGGGRNYAQQGQNQGYGYGGGGGGGGGRGGRGGGRRW